MSIFKIRSKSSFIIIGIPLLVISAIYNVLSQVNVSFNDLNDNWLADNLWDITVENISGASVEFSLKLTVSDSSGAKIYDARTESFTIQAKQSRYFSKDRIGELYFGEIRPEQLKSISRTGTFLGGHYQVCIFAIAKDNMEEMSKECKALYILEASAPRPVSPFNDAIAGPGQILFSWLPPESMHAERQFSYSLVIRKQYQGQSVEDALTQNLIWYRIDGLYETSVRLPIQSWQLAVASPVLEHRPGIRELEEELFFKDQLTDRFIWQVLTTDNYGLEAAPPSQPYVLNIIETYDEMEEPELEFNTPYIVPSTINLNDLFPSLGKKGERNLSFDSYCLTLPMSGDFEVILKNAEGYLPQNISIDLGFLNFPEGNGISQDSAFQVRWYGMDQFYSEWISTGQHLIWSINSSLINQLLASPYSTPLMVFAFTFRDILYHPDYQKIVFCKRGFCRE